LRISRKRTNCLPLVAPAVQTKFLLELVRLRVATRKSATAETNERTRKSNPPLWGSPYLKSTKPGACFCERFLCGFHYYTSLPEVFHFYFYFLLIFFPLFHFSLRVGNWDHIWGSVEDFSNKIYKEILWEKLYEFCTSSSSA